MRLNQRFPKSLKSVAERHRHSAPLGRYIMRPKAVYHMQRIYHTAKLYIIVKHGRTSLLPYFATGCHAHNFKIAASLRSSQWHKFETFSFGKQMFLVVFSRFQFGSTSCFPAKPIRFVIARRAHFLRPTRQSLTKRFAIP